MNTWLNRATNLLFLVLATLCQVYLIRDSFHCVSDPSLLFWLIAVCVLLWFSGSFRRGLWIGMPLSAVLLYAAFRFYRSDPLDALWDFVDRLAGAYGYSSTAVEVFAGTHSLMLLLFGFLLSAVLICALTAKSGRIPLSVISTLPVFVGCIIVNGEPPVLCALGILLFWALLLVTGSSFRPDGYAWRSFLCTLLPICAVLGLVFYFYRPETYVFTERDFLLREQLDRFGHNLGLFIGSSSETVYSSDPEQPNEGQGQRSRFQSSWLTENNQMDLTQSYNENSHDLRILQILSETTGKLYLRTQSFGDYNGNGWLPAEELNAGSSLPFTAFAAAASPNGQKRELEVRTFLDLPALCLPYYSAISTGSDVLAETGGQIDYRVSYTDYTGKLSELRLPPEAVQGELTYRAYAHDAYTRLPVSTRDAALKICKQANLTATSPNRIEEVAEFVRQSGEYDINTEAYPSVDYAIYFLTEARRGYCIHFATAATVLYRALGIPARVTEGFLVDAKAGRYCDVRADAAHAWVEVYVDSVGWIPVEVTGRSGSIAQPTAPSPSPEAEVPPEETENPSSGESPSGPSTSPTPNQDTVESPDEPPVSPSSKPFLWKTLLFIMAILLLLPLRYALSRICFTLRLRQSDGRRASVAIWKYAKRTEKYGYSMPEEIAQCAEKAVFSQHTVSRAEVSASRSLLLKQIHETYIRLPKRKKLRFRFWDGLC